MNRFGSYLDQNEGEKGGYMPRMNLEGYGVGVINYRGIYYDAGEFRMTSYGKFFTQTPNLGEGEAV